MSLRDHTYYRCFEPGIDSDQYNGSQLLAREGNVQLAALESTRDSFETILVCLLRAYARNTGADNEEISGEALSTLSQDQLQSLVTSNTVHYDVIQQILLLKQKEGTFTTAPAGYDELGLQTPPPLSDPGTPGAGAVPSLPSEQLKEIQFQVAELIRNHQVPIPPDASLDQQQTIIHQYILTHLALLQQQAQRKLGGQGSLTPSHDPLVRSHDPLVRSAPAKLIIPQDSMPLSPDLQSPPFNPQFPRNASSVVQSALQASLSNQSAVTVGELTDLVDSSHASIGRVGVARGKTSTSGLGMHKWAETNQEGKGRRDVDETKKPPSFFNMYYSRVTPQLPETNLGRYKAQQHELLTQTFQTATEKQQPQVGHSDHALFPGVQPLPSEVPSQDEEEEEEEDEGEATRGHGTQTRVPMHCLLGGCSNMAVFSEDRGQHYCSNECLVKHARLGFQAWVAQRKAKA